MKAILETEFDPDMMIDQESLDKDYGGDWNKFIAEMYREEGLGIFDELKFLRVEDSGSSVWTEKQKRKAAAEANWDMNR